MHWRLFLTSISVCLGGSLHFGIQLTVVNTSESVFQDFINSTHHQHYGSYITENAYHIIWSLILNLMYAGTMVGTLSIVKLSETIGRRRTFYISAGFILGGLLGQILSKVTSSYELLAIGRFCVGIGCGITLPLQSMYLNEISPLEMRGFISGMTGIFVELGYITGGVLALPIVLGTENHWLFIFVAEAIPALILLFAIPFLHESPRYLLSRQEFDAAIKSLEFFGHKNPKATIHEIQTELESQKNEVTWWELWDKCHLRRAIFISIVIILAVNLSGIIVVDFFSTKILVDVGFPHEIAQYASVGIFSGTLTASLIGGFFVEKVGRRLLLLTTTCALILINTALMTFSIIYDYNHVQWAGWASIVACASLTLAFGFGPSVLQFIVPPELVPQNARSRVQLVVMFVQNVTGGVVGFIFYPLKGIAGPYAFLLFIIPSIFFVIFFYQKFPETKRKTPMEVMKALGFEEEILNFGITDIRKVRVAWVLNDIA